MRLNVLTLQSTNLPPTVSPLKLTPVLSDQVISFVNERTLLFDLIDGFGSPLNVLFPENLHANLQLFNDTFAKNNVSGRAFFAHKCNQSDSLTRQLGVEACGIDVSSVKELQHALCSGFVAERIEVTGPKSLELLALSIQHGVWINIDSLSELRQLIALQKQIKQHPPVRVLLRLSGFRSEHSRFLSKSSRFGIPIMELGTALTELEQNPQIQLEGFSFHLDTVTVLERTVAIESCLEAFDAAISRGFNPRVLDIGGGYKVNYLANGEDWNRYTTALKESVLGAAPPLTWQGNAFGLHAEKGVLKGNFNSYAYFDQQTGGHFLNELLNQRLSSMANATVASVMRDNMIELWIEPGRAIVDQCGITLARVINIHPSSTGDVIVNLAMKRQDITFLDQEIFVDPLILHRQAPDNKQPTSVFFAGNLCLESDLIYRHKTFLDALPAPGDVVAFVNTAGYFMDFSATQSIMNPLARKVAVRSEHGRLRWCLDECYWPYSMESRKC
jgi:diaminopimelate decarboxylase